MENRIYGTLGDGNGISVLIMWWICFLLRHLTGKHQIKRNRRHENWCRCVIGGGSIMAGCNQKQMLNARNAC